MVSRRSLNNIHVFLRLESQWIYYFWQDPEEVCYDLKYALRLCSEHNKQKACVHIYSTMGLFEEAVDLSLKVSPPVIILSVWFCHLSLPQQKFPLDSTNSISDNCLCLLWAVGMGKENISQRTCESCSGPSSLWGSALKSQKENTFLLLTARKFIL